MRTAPRTYTIICTRTETWTDVVQAWTLTEAEQLVPTLQEKGILEDRTGSLMELPVRLLSTDTPHSSYLKISEGCDSNM